MNRILLRGAALLPLMAVAQEPPSVNQPKVLSTIKVESEEATGQSQAATRLPLTLRETPQSLTVFTAERIEDQNLLSLREILDQTPGIYSYAYDTERVVFTARGFTIDSLLYDGVPAETNFSTGSIDETVDTAMFERIEIVRGATGLMSGAGSPAASVNLVRKRADRTEPGVDFEISAGSWNNRRIDADVGTALTSDGNVRARFVAAWQDRESYQDLYENERTVLYAVLDADLSAATLLSLSFSYQDNDPTSNTWGSFPLYLGDGTFANWSRNVTTSTDWAFWNRRTESAVAELRHEFANGWSLRSSLIWREFNENLALFYVYGFPDPDTGLGLEPFAYRSTSRIIERALDVYASGPFEWSGREHRLLAGYNGSRARNTGLEFAHGPLAPVPDFFEWDGSYPEPDFAADGNLLQDIDSRQNGAYLAGRFSLADPLTLIAGARYATWKGEHFYLYDSPDVTFAEDYRRVIPYAGLVYDISGGWSAFASFTEIFKPQLARDVDGEYLDPVDGRSVEAGIKGEHFDRRFSTALTLFETRQNNVAAPAIDPDTGVPAEPFPDGTVPSMPIDGTRTRGFELEASGALPHDVNLSLGWSRYQIEDADGVAVRTYVPRTLVRAFARWDASERLSLGGGVNWQSDSHTLVSSSPTEAAVQRQGEVLQLNLMARFVVRDSIALQVNANNLLDEKYFVLDEYGNSCFGAPANYSASLRWSF